MSLNDNVSHHRRMNPYAYSQPYSYAQTDAELTDEDSDSMELSQTCDDKKDADCDKMKQAVGNAVGSMPMAGAYHPGMHHMMSPGMYGGAYGSYYPYYDSHMMTRPAKTAELVHRNEMNKGEAIHLNKMDAGATVHANKIHDIEMRHLDE